MVRICIVPEVSGVGGMASFRRKFEAGLSARGIGVTHDTLDAADAVLVIAGTRKLLALWNKRRAGARVVQRLDGINWVHRRRHTGLRHYLRAEYGNLLLAIIRSRIATHIVYQSEFSHRWWENWYGKTGTGHSVVHNGVDLSAYRPGERAAQLEAPCRLLIVEGSLDGGYEMGLDNGVRLAEALSDEHGFRIELTVVGKITAQHKSDVEGGTGVPITWAGVLPPAEVVKRIQAADLLFSADLHPACPNSVIEALACGLPVVAFDTGALNELVSAAAGRVVPYGADPWKIETPDIAALAKAAADVLHDEAQFRRGARSEAEQHLGLDAMMDGYLKALLEG